MSSKLHAPHVGPIPAEPAGSAATMDNWGTFVPAPSDREIHAMAAAGDPAAGDADGRFCRVAAFDDRVEAERAVDELHQAGFGRDDIGFALRGDDVGRGGMITDEPGALDGNGAVRGAIAGGVAGSLLGAVASLVIPGVGPVLAAGFIASALGFGAAGVATGGILGAMAGLGVSEDEAHFYAREFDAGKALVIVRRGIAGAGRAMQILARHGGTCAHRVPDAGR
jgi:hypothetical protein